MRDFLDRIHWPQAILLIATLASLVAFPILFFAIVPERIVDKVIGLPWMTIVTLGIPALVIALSPIASAFMRSVVAKTEPDSKAPNVVNVPVVVSRSSRTGGFVDVHLLAELVLGSLLALGAAVLLHGCGPSAFRMHATASHEIHGAVETAGDAITGATSLRVAACPHDDGDERTACLDTIEREATTAAAARDALILPSNAYRAELLRDCGVDPDAEGARVPDDCPDPPADVMVHLIGIATSTWRDWPAFAAAMRALGAPVPDVTRPGGL